MSIADRILRVKSSLPGQVELVAVSKTYPAQRIMEAYEAGQRIFGENRPQEMAQKYEELPKDIEWHLIGCPTCGCGVSWAWRPTPATSRSSGGISPLCNGIRASCRPISGRSSIPFRSECPTTTGSLSNTERRWCVSVR